MIAWFAKNPVAANLLMLAILVGGGVAMWSGVRLEVFPPEKVRTVSVSVTLIGATPEDVELGVAVRVEQAVRDLEGIDRIVSRAAEGGVTVQIEAEAGYDPRILLEDVKARVDAINALPEQAERPVVGLEIDTYETIAVVVSGVQGEAEIRQFAEQVRLDLLREENITHVELEAARPFEVAVEVEPDRLREFGLTLAAISAAIRESSIDISAGNIRADGGDILIRSKGQAYRRDEFESIVVKTEPDGSIIRIRDIASVNDGFEEGGVVTRFNGKNAAIVAVYRVGDQNAVEIAGTVKAYIDSRTPGLPQGLELSYWDDESASIESRLGIMLSSAMQGSVLVILLLSLFLRPAVAGWVFLGIPISFIGSFIFLYWFGISLNLMSAFGFILVLGIVVDDAIVTGENVFSHLRAGKNGLEAAIDGTREVAIPVTFGILTTIAAFTPLALMDGDLGEFFQPVSLVVIPVLLLSLVESKLVLPAHLRHIRESSVTRENGFTRWQKNLAHGLETAIHRYYRPVLETAILYRYATFATFCGVLLLVAALIAGGWTRWVFFPDGDSETAYAAVVMPAGTPFELTDSHIRRIAEAAEQLREKYRNPATGASIITNIIATTGASDEEYRPNVGEVQFEMAPLETRDIALSTTDLANEWRDLAGPVTGAESVLYRSSFFRPGDPVDVQLSGNSLAMLDQVADALKAWLDRQAGVFDISDSLSNGKQELQVELKPLGHVLGLTRNDIVSQIGQAFQGLESQRIQRGQDEVRVLVRYPLSQRDNFASLNDMPIAAPDGSLVPLSGLADLQPGRGPSEITRIDQNRVINVTADVDKELVNVPDLQVRLQDYLNEVLEQYPSIYYSLEGEEREEERSMQSLSRGLLVALGVIYCLLALPLKSYLQPFVIMAVIPFGLIGAVIGHWIMGYPLSIVSVLGMIALTGVVINDSLVLVDFTNRRLSRGDTSEQAVKAAALKRFRPVLLTSLTTFSGLVPLLLERSTTAQLLIPMGVSLGFGILFATLITLIMVPVTLLIVSDLETIVSERLIPGKTAGRPA